MDDLESSTLTAAAALGDVITVGKARVLNDRGDEAAIFTMTLGGETINLLPLRNWSQLDLYKWRARGKLPGTPAGLEITFDHVKVAGEPVSITDPEGAEKLQKLLNEWLALELKAQHLERQKAHARATVAEQPSASLPQNLTPRFRVEVDKEGQVHIHCHRGKETLVTIGLNPSGFSRLFSEGLMHKPRALKAGALHDWVELDGELFSFEKGNDDTARLEQALNGRYLPSAVLGQGRDVVVLTNAASSTGFDIQFAAKVGGVTERRRRPLNEDALELLQEPEKCGLLPKDLVIKLSRPHLIFKRKTADGGERYLDEGPESVVQVVGDAGEVTLIDLTKPVNYSRLSAVELTAMFNHPTLNQLSRAAPRPVGTDAAPGAAPAAAPPLVERPAPTILAMPPPQQPAPAPQAEIGPRKESPKSAIPNPRVVESAVRLAQAIRPLPNLWLQPVLSRASISHPWFTCLVYTKLAEYFGRSDEGFFGPFPCWVCSLGEIEDISDPAFRGVFLTQKGWLGYLNQGQLARFRNEIAFVGTVESSFEGIGVSLVAVAADLQQRIVFIVNENYRTKFGLPEQTVAQELARLKTYGVCVLSISEALQSPDPLQVVWTVPAGQEAADAPQAAEHRREDGSSPDSASRS